MERASDFLGRVARRLGRPEAALAWLRSSWPAIVGPALAGHTRPSACRDGVLEVLADAQSWRAELEAVKPQFCQRVNQAWGAPLVRDVRFAARASAAPGTLATAPPPRLPREADNAHLPFIRRRPR
ncbi:MAG TPA: DUF721 domain-containing protein [Candidatus Acidoferrales bacterium]|nr:DUF721 domain-containing protein [Candidatus Acidoferrales bacterium]